jgi:hypothetical protein
MVKYAEGDVEGGLVNAFAIVILKDVAIRLEDILLIFKAFIDPLFYIVQG